MYPVCSACHRAAPRGERFCRFCGTSLRTTQGEETLVAHTARFEPSPSVTPATGSAPSQPRGDEWFDDSIEQLVFVCDVSYSMDEMYDGNTSKLAAVRRAGRSLIHEKSKLAPDDSVGLVVFAQQARIEVPLVPLQSEKQRLLDAFRGLTSGPGTDINAGLKAARDAFDWHEPSVRRRIILLTDGQGGHPLGTAEFLKSQGVKIEVIGIGPSPAGVSEPLLKEVASVVGGETLYRFIRDEQTLVKETTLRAEARVV